MVRLLRLRRLLVSWLRALVAWIDPDPAFLLAPPVGTLVPTILLHAAVSIVSSLEPVPHTGAYKRLLAIKTLRGRYPKASTRLLALAIELAVRQKAQQEERRQKERRQGVSAEAAS